MSKPLQGALIGAGAISRFHMSAWEQIPEAKIVAVADINLVAAQKMAERFNIPHEMVFDNPAKMLESISLDFVDIAAPPEAHPQLTQLAAMNGVNVNCQKPFALSLADAKSMIDSCQNAGVVLNINENWRWRVWYRKIQQIILDGKIGKPVYFRIFSHSSRFIPENSPHKSRFDWKHVLLFEIGVHHVDILRFLFGDPINVTARTMDVSSVLSGEDRAIVLFDFPDKLAAILDLSWSSYAPAGYADRDTYPIEDCRIEGNLGTIELVRDAQKGNLIRLTNFEGIQEFAAHPDRTPSEAYLDSYIAAQSHFIDCLLTGKTPETSAIDNYQTLVTVLAAYRSAELYQTIQIAKFEEFS